MTSDFSGSRLRRAFPWIWLATSALWAVVIFVTGQLAWPLALWLSTTLGPLSYLRNSKNRSEPRGPDRKGNHE